MHVDGLAARFASPWRSAADGLGEAPPLPVRGAPRGRTQRRTRDLDAEDLTGVSDDEVANSLGQRRAPAHHRVVDVPRLLKRAPLRVREAHEDPLLTRMGERRPATGCHGLSDITISGIRTSGLGTTRRAREGRVALVVAGRQVCQCRVAPARIVPALEEVEHGAAGGGRRREPLPVQQLALEGREEASFEIRSANDLHDSHPRGIALSRAIGYRGAAQQKEVKGRRG